ncbi:MAG: ROK family protein [Deltaproteobacteria bacterium]|nr:ROK family protein [Deltaproteobacteria bacterium]
MSEENRVMGIDIGGTGVKAALVDTQNGTMTSERVRLPTPQPATPAAVMEAIKELQRQLQWQGTVGCGFPGLVKSGRVQRAPNLDSSWIGYDLAGQLQAQLGAPRVAIGNDADAAGLAEFRFGAGRGAGGTVLVITLGTGIGSAIFRDGVLLPDTELGHLAMHGKVAEKWAAASIRTNKDLSWKKWARRLNDYLVHVEYLLGVDLFIIGGGVSKKPAKFFPYLQGVGGRVEAARLGNAAGIIGAALFPLR